MNDKPLRYTSNDCSLLYPPSVLILDKTEQEIVCDTIIDMLKTLEDMRNE